MWFPHSWWDVGWGLLFRWWAPPGSAYFPVNPRILLGSNFKSLPVDHPRALSGEGEQGWAGMGREPCLRKPGQLQMPARPPRLYTGPACHLGPGCASWLAPHSWGAAAALMDGCLPRQGSEPTGLPATGLGSHGRDLSSSSQPRHPVQQNAEAGGSPRLSAPRLNPSPGRLSPAASGSHCLSWGIPFLAPLMLVEARRVKASGPAVSDECLPELLMSGVL